MRKKMYTYAARVTETNKRFTLEMPRPLRQGDDLTSGLGGGYRVAYVLDEKKRTPVVILVRTPGVKRRPGRPRKNPT